MKFRGFFVTWMRHLVLFLLNKKARGTTKLCFTHKDQSGRLNFELSYNERTLDLVESIEKVV